MHFGADVLVVRFDGAFYLAAPRTHRRDRGWHCARRTWYFRDARPDFSARIRDGARISKEVFLSSEPNPCFALNPCGDFLATSHRFLVSPQGFGTEQGFPNKSFSHQEPILAPPSIRAVTGLATSPPCPRFSARIRDGARISKELFLSSGTNPCSALNPCGDFLATSHRFLVSPQGFGTEQGFPKNSFSHQEPILAPPSIRAVTGLATSPPCPRFSARIRDGARISKELFLSSGTNPCSALNPCGDFLATSHRLLGSPQGFGTGQGFPKKSSSHQEPILASPSIRAVIPLRAPTVSSVLRKDSGRGKDFQTSLSLIRNQSLLRPQSVR
jgi:hypothetical protein